MHALPVERFFPDHLGSLPVNWDTFDHYVSLMRQATNQAILPAVMKLFERDAYGLHRFALLETYVLGLTDAEGLTCSTMIGVVFYDQSRDRYERMVVRQLVSPPLHGPQGKPIVEALEILTP